MIQKGKFIVIEGTDGSGKKTQLDLLRKNLKRGGQRYEVLDFPQYYSSFWGAMVGRYLNGEFGGLDDVSPYLAAPLYALDQASRRKDIIKWKGEGKFVLSNRYLSSSMGHQTAKLPDDEQEDFLRWLLEAGYKHLKMVREDLVIVLYVPVEYSFKLANSKKSKERKKYITNGKEIAESNFEHQSRAVDTFVSLCKRFDHWKLVECVDEKNRLRSKKAIQAEILKILHNLDYYDGQLAMNFFA